MCREMGLRGRGSRYAAYDGNTLWPRNAEVFERLAEKWQGIGQQRTGVMMRTLRSPVAEMARIAYLKPIGRL